MDKIAMSAKKIYPQIYVFKDNHEPDLSLCFSDRKFDIYSKGGFYYLRTIKFKDNSDEEIYFEVSPIITDDLTNILLFLILTYWFSRVIDFSTRKNKR